MENKKKVLLIGTDFFGYTQSVARGFEAHGWEVRTFLYTTGPDRFSKYLFYRMLPFRGRRHYVDVFLKHLNERIREAYRE